MYQYQCTSTKQVHTNNTVLVQPVRIPDVSVTFSESVLPRLDWHCGDRAVGTVTEWPGSDSDAAAH